MISTQLHTNQNESESFASKIETRAVALFNEQKLKICLRTDKLFAGLFFIQWFGAVFWALLKTPASWEGSTSSLHIHVLQCLVLGAILISLPLYMILRRPGKEMTRHLVAAAQMLFSGLLIAASGGRIETHFHVFGSLAFLAFYRDWKPLVTASLVTAADHLIRGIYAPATIYGVSYPEPWRWVEHTCWVLFCDIFLTVSILQSQKDMRLVSRRQAELEMTNDSIEQEVRLRTSELRQSEQDLRDSEATIRTIFETAADSIITISENGLIERTNRTCEIMFGYQFHQLFGKHISFLIKSFSDQQLNQESWPKLREMAVKAKPALRLEGLGAGSRKGEFPIEIALSHVDMKGRKLMTAIIRDITERKEAERRVSEFYSIVSHELRTPLTSIRGSLGLIEGGLAGELSIETSELVGIARESCDRLIRLINDILDLKKLEMGKFVFHKLELKSSDLLKSALASTQGMADERAVRLELGWTTEQTVLADPDRIQQVLVNLLSNAIKYAPKNSAVELSATAQAGAVKFSVRDSGKGISSDKQHMLFKKFQQIDSSDKRQQEGTGLGLAICKAIIDQHGGEIGVDSKEGEGAKFWFTLPFQTSSEFAPEAGSEQSHVLVIEAESQLCGKLDSKLLPENCMITRAESSKQAAELLSERVPDIVIFNIAEPGCDEFELQEQLRVIYARHGKPMVVLASGSSEESSGLILDWRKAPVQDEELLFGVKRAIGAKNCPVVLVVEDDYSTRRTLVHLLETHGVECIEASGGKEALQLVASKSPQLIVLDVGLPDLDGFQFVKELEGSARSTPVLVYTGRDLSAEERKQLTIGFTRYLTKSKASQEDLLKAVDELLGQMRLKAKGQEEPEKEETENDN